MKKIIEYNNATGMTKEFEYVDSWDGAVRNPAEQKIGNQSKEVLNERIDQGRLHERAFEYQGDCRLRDYRSPLWNRLSELQEL